MIHIYIILLFITGFYRYHEIILEVIIRKILGSIYETVRNFVDFIWHPFVKLWINLEVDDVFFGDTIENQILIFVIKNN